MKWSNKGQTIIEAIVALAAILVAISAIAVVVTLSVSNATYVKSQNLANKYAQDGMEFLRNAESAAIPVKVGATSDETSASNVDFFDLLGSYCFHENNILSPGSTATCTVGSSTAFKREVYVDDGCAGDISGGGKEVTVIVRWSGTKCNTGNTFCHESKLVSCFKEPAASESQL